MKAMWTVIREQVQSVYLTMRLASFEVKSQNNNQYLGMLWEVITPLIQIAIYWFVFGFGIRGGHPVNGVPFFQWMLSGIVVWFFIHKGISQGSKSVYKRVKIIAKMNFPMSVIPSFVVMSNFYSHLWIVAIVFLVLQLTGFPVSFHMIQLPYFMFATIVLLIALTILTSTITTIVRDVQQFIQASMRMLLYLSPILWPPQSIGINWIETVMKINPFYYIIEGYRSALLGTVWYPIAHPWYTLYFWAVVIVILAVGSQLHMKFRHRFVDYL